MGLQPRVEGKRTSCLDRREHRHTWHRPAPHACASGQQNNHPIELNTPAVTHQKLDYLHNNPDEAGFVRYQEDYLYSSAMGGGN